MSQPAHPLILGRRLIAAWILLGLAAGCGEPGPPTRPEHHASPPGAPHQTDPLPGERNTAPRQIVVTMAEGQGPDAINIALGTVTLGVLHEINSYLLRVPQSIPMDQILDMVAGFPGVEAVDYNWLLQSPESEQASLAFNDGSQTAGQYHDQDFLERIEAPGAHSLSTGNGILVAVIDTGIELSHPALAGHITLDGYDFVDEDPFANDEANGIDEDGDGLIDEAAGHGTHVAGLVLLGAPGVELQPLRVLDSEGWGSSFNVARAVIHAAERNATVINMSVGMRGNQPQLQQAIRWAADRGVVLVGAAGNGGREAPDHYPAGYPEVLAVAATDGDDIVASFSNYGRHIDLCAPGVGILSTYLNGKYAIWSGTSMSAPLVAAGAALVRAYNPSLDRTQVGKALGAGANGIESWNPRYVRMIGSGRINYRGALRIIGAD